MSYDKFRKALENFDRALNLNDQGQNYISAYGDLYKIAQDMNDPFVFGYVVKLSKDFKNLGTWSDLNNYLMKQA